MNVRSPTTWVIVASLDHARRGLDGGFVMANHGRRAPLARMSAGDRVLIYSPKATYPDGAPLKSIAIVGEITGAEPVDSPVIPDGFSRAADLREIEPLTLDDVRDHLPLSALRFGCFALDDADGQAIWAMAEARRSI